jgi:hypothetical protein
MNQLCQVLWVDPHHFRDGPRVILENKPTQHATDRHRPL